MYASRWQYIATAWPKMKRSEINIFVGSDIAVLRSRILGKMHTVVSPVRSSRRLQVCGQAAAECLVRRIYAPLDMPPLSSPTRPRGKAGRVNPRINRNVSRAVLRRDEEGKKVDIHPIVQPVQPGPAAGALRPFICPADAPCRPGRGRQVSRQGERLSEI